ncbi:hypothetical protein, partial [Sphingomonas sp. DC1600-2]|uniref:hypothetical protein n=2 Tax=Sphingomonas TaxID=13687 RepID=UPI003CFB51AE
TKTTKGKITSLTQNPLCGTYLHPGQFSMEIPGHFSAEIYSELVSRRLSTGASGNVILTPLGTKAQVLGFTLFFIHECNGLPASIIFPFSSEYAPETSTGLARAWHYQIEF